MNSSGNEIDWKMDVLAPLDKIIQLGPPLEEAGTALESAKSAVPDLPLPSFGLASASRECWQAYRHRSEAARHRLKELAREMFELERDRAFVTAGIIHTDVEIAKTLGVRSMDFDPDLWVGELPSGEVDETASSLEHRPLM